jgi:hypothetical protein
MDQPSARSTQAARKKSTPNLPEQPRRGQTAATSPLRRLRKNIGAMLEYVWQLSAAFRAIRADALLIKGHERISGEPMTVFYFGNYENYAYMVERLFRDYEIVNHHENVLALKVNSWTSKYYSQVSLVFLDVELLYCKLVSREHYVQMPSMVNLKLRLYESWDRVVEQFRKNTRRVDLRKVRKYELSYRISHDEQDYLDFYQYMYKPYLIRRFQDKVVLEPEWKVLRQCRKGELIHIRRGDQTVAAAVLHQLDGRLASLWVGVPEDLPEDLYRGAFAGLYYFTIQYAYEQGCTVVDFLGSKPLLNDGSFQFKRRWGVYLEENPAPWGDILLRPVQFTPAVKNVFVHNPCIAREGVTLVGKALLSDGNSSQTSVKKLYEQFYCEGLAQLKIYSLEGFESDALVWAAEQGGRVQLIDLSGETDPPEAFCR